MYPKKLITVQVTGLDADDVLDIQLRASEIVGFEMSRSAAVRWAVRQNVLASRTDVVLTPLQKAEIEKRKALAEAARVRAALGQAKLDAPRLKAEARKEEAEYRAERAAAGRAREAQKAYEWRVGTWGQDQCDAYCREHPESDEAQHYQTLHAGGDDGQDDGQDGGPAEAPAAIPDAPAVDWREHVRKLELAAEEFRLKQAAEYAAQEAAKLTPEQEMQIEGYYRKLGISFEQQRAMLPAARREIERAALGLAPEPAAGTVGPGIAAEEHP